MDPEPMPLAGDVEEQRVARELMGRFDAPSFVRRAKRVEETYQLLLERLRRQRAEHLEIVGLRLGQVVRLAGGWDALRPWLPDAETLTDLRALHDELRPRLRLPPERTSSPRVLAAALGELREVTDLFNRRWEKFLAKLDLGPVNGARDAYNRYYLLERECALGASRHARESFRALKPLDARHFRDLFPPLRLPEFRPPG